MVFFQRISKTLPFRSLDLGDFNQSSELVSGDTLRSSYIFIYILRSCSHEVFRCSVIDRNFIASTSSETRRAYSRAVEFRPSVAMAEEEKDAAMEDESIESIESRAPLDIPYPVECGKPNAQNFHTFW